MKLNREMVVQIAEASIIETIEAFVRFRPGFHGDLMTGFPTEEPLRAPLSETAQPAGSAEDPGQR